MKKSIFTLALMFIALFGFNTLSAQSLASYTAVLNGTQLSLSNAKVGGFGSKTRTLEFTLFLEVTSSVTCEKIVTLGNGRENIITIVKSQSSKDQETIMVDGKGSGMMVGPLIVEGADMVAGCPNDNSGFQEKTEDGEALVRAWVVITGYDSKGNILKQSEPIDIVF